MNKPDHPDPLPPVVAALATPRGFWAKSAACGRHFVAIVIWFYVVTKLSVFDIDNYVFDHYLPEYRWLIDYKLFVFVGLIGLVAAIFQKWRVIRLLSFVLFYPLVVGLWIVPYTVFATRSWIVGIVMVNAIFRFFATFKSNAISTGLLSIGTLLVTISPSNYTVVAGMVALATFQLALYYTSAKSVFATDPVYDAYRKVFSWIGQNTIKVYSLGPEYASVPTLELSQNQLDKRKTNLEVTVLSNRLMLYVADKLKMYAEARINIFSGIVKCILLVVLSILVFSLLNLGLYRLDGGQFRLSGEGDSSFFLFLYYSFRTFFAGSIDEIAPRGTLAQLLLMLEYLFGVLTTAILLSALFSQHNIRQSRAIDEAIASIEKDAKELEGFLVSEFRVTTVEEAIAELERLKASMIGVVLWLSRSSR